MRVKGWDAAQLGEHWVQCAVDTRLIPSCSKGFPSRVIVWCRLCNDVRIAPVCVHVH